MGSDVFFDADSESPHMTLGKNATLRSYRRKTVFSRSRDQCAANWFDGRCASRISSKFRGPAPEMKMERAGQ